VVRKHANLIPTGFNEDSGIGYCEKQNQGFSLDNTIQRFLNFFISPFAPESLWQKNRGVIAQVEKVQVDQTLFTCLP